MEEIQVLADSGMVLYDPHREMVLIQRECRYEISFEAKIGSSEYVPGYGSRLLYAGGSYIHLKEEDGLLGWSSGGYAGGTFMAFIDQDNYFDSWHYYLVTFLYDDASNSWNIELNVDGQDSGLISCSPPHFNPTFAIFSDQLTLGSTTMIDRRIRNITYIFAHNNLMYPGDAFAGPGVTFEGNDIVYYSVDPEEQIYCSTSFDPTKAACCFRNVTEINRFDTSVSASGSMHYQGCCCSECDSDDTPQCGCPSDDCPPNCAPCDKWPPPCNPCIPSEEGGCGNPSDYCNPAGFATQDASSSISGEMLPILTRVAYDPDRTPGPFEFMLFWGLSQGSGTDLSPKACNLYAYYTLGESRALTSTVPDGFHGHTCQDCDFTQDQSQDAEGLLEFDTSLPPFGGWPPSRGSGEVTLVTSGHATMNAIAFITCPMQYPVHYDDFDLSPLKDSAYHCTNNESNSQDAHCVSGNSNGTFTMSSFIS
jgi:hypothetical protein